MSEILKISNLCCSYGENLVLNEINFSVSAGEFVGIIGPNGSGKTSLLRAVTKILKPDKGEIFVAGKNLEEYSFRELARQIAVIPQVLEIYFPFTVQEFVSLGRYVHSDLRNSDEIVEKILRETDIYELRNKNIKKLSGGERQRAIVAQALVQEPKIIFSDEPVTHLDIKYQVEVLNLLKKQNEEGVTVLVIFHDLNLASEYCERLIILSEGRKVADGFARDVLKPEIIKEVYKTEVEVTENPVTHKPYIYINRVAKFY